MTKDKRRQALILILLTIFCTIVLGISLPNLVLLPALPFPGADANSLDVDSPQSASDSPKLSSPWIFQVGLALGILLLSVALLTALVKKASIKQVVVFASILLIFFAFFSILPNLPDNQPTPVHSQTDPPQLAQIDYLTAPIGEPPADMLFWVKIVVLLVCVILVGWLIMCFFKRSQIENPLAVEAESAIQALTGGEDLGKIIIKCYVNMEKIISQERGIDRNHSMTPREFEDNLISNGIPQVPIQQLTTLFEKARYGIQILTEQDELIALNSLSAIRKTCQTKKKGAY